MSAYTKRYCLQSLDLIVAKGKSQTVSTVHNTKTYNAFAEPNNQNK